MNKYVLVTAATLLATPALAAESRFDRADSDGDGTVTLAEFENAALERSREIFSRLDADSSGTLTADEVSRLQRDRRGGHHGRRFGPERMMRRLDTDNSGSLSQSELDGFRFSPDADEFVAADADGSGELDREEIRGLMRERREARRAGTQQD